MFMVTYTLKYHSFSIKLWRSSHLSEFRIDIKWGGSYHTDEHCYIGSKSLNAGNAFIIKIHGYDEGKRDEFYQ